jgi:hypothetical protein
MVTFIIISLEGSCELIRQQKECFLFGRFSAFPTTSNQVLRNPVIVLPPNYQNNENTPNVTIINRVEIKEGPPRSGIKGG